MKKINFNDYIAIVKDFPKKGIMFKDWTPLMNNAVAYNQLIDCIYAQVKNLKVNVIVAPESRGFWLGCPLATKMKVRFVPVRKPNKLPRKTSSVTFDLEYGKDTLQISQGDIKSSDRVLIVDDMIATGGTIEAINKLVKKAKAKISGYAFICSIPECNGIDSLKKSKLPIFLAIK